VKIFLSILTKPCLIKGLALVLLTGLLTLQPWRMAMATKWPERPVTLIVPFPAGSATDLLARTLSEELTKALGQTFIVENKAGANGTIGATSAANAKPDGYTFLVATSTTHAANASLFKKLQYDPIKDFSPVSRLAEIPFVLLTNLEVPATSAGMLASYIRANPGKISWGSGSSGSQLPGFAFASMSGLDVVHVPYKGVPPALLDTIGNVIQFTFADLATALPQIKAGKLRPLGVTSAQAHPLLPSVPALTATVMPGFEMTAWFALYAPASVNQRIITALNKAVQDAMALQKVQTRLSPSGFTAKTSSPQELGLFAAKETVKWAKAVSQAGIIPE
jgi:tripartite-type tricarboxylate transporter receptor subunit TctC